MRLNSKTVAPVAVLSLALTACGHEDYRYEVSGSIHSMQIDYDCKSQAMEPAAFAAPARTSGGSSSGGSGSSGSRSGSSGSSTSGSRGGSNISSGGAGMNSKPKAPKKVGDAPAIQQDGHRDDLSNPKRGCKAKYEIFVKNKDGIFEQDVDRKHYQRCRVSDRFPECTK